jgi:hypothetical protein
MPRIADSLSSQRPRRSITWRCVRLPGHRAGPSAKVGHRSASADKTINGLSGSRSSRGDVCSSPPGLSDHGVDT